MQKNENTMREEYIVRQALPQPDGSHMLLGVGLAMVLAVSTFFAGMFLGNSQQQVATNNLDATQTAFTFLGFSTAVTPPPSIDESEDLQVFWQVWELLDDKFVAGSGFAGLSDEEKIHGAISGLVDAYGDDYTTFFPPVEAEAFEADISGEFGGVGMEVGLRDDVITVIAPLSGSPAEAAGILPGDYVIAINGSSTEGMNLDEGVQRIRGPKGSTVTLTLVRSGEPEAFDVPVVRDTIAIPTLEVEDRGDVFVISLFSFNALAEQKMHEAMKEYVASDADKLVLDLRGNPGGFLTSAVSVSSYFLPRGTEVVRENFGESFGEKIHRSENRTIAAEKRENIVVLLNGGSASASEIVAGALHDYGVATLVGETTFGKGSVQELLELPDDSSLKVTIARWLTPEGVNLSEGGIEPDIAVGRTLEDFEAGIDPQLDAAVEFLRTGTTTAPVVETE